MITGRNLQLKIHGKQILKGVDFGAENGKITVLLGKNGSGKTTLLRCLNGDRHHCLGEIRIDGCNICTLYRKQLAKYISIMPQNLPRPAVTVRELVSFGRYPYLSYGGKLSPSDWEHLDGLMQSTGIFHHANDIVANLSGGERQLAFFTMLLAQNTQNVLLDEPTASLDTEYRHKVYQFIKKMKAANKTVVVTLHSLNDAVELADNIFVLEEGQCVFWGSTQEFIKSAVPEEIFKQHPVQVKSEREGEFTIFR